jgi:hypothetical protein
MGTTSATAFHTPGVLLRLLNAFAVLTSTGACFPMLTNVLDKAFSGSPPKLRELRGRSDNAAAPSFCVPWDLRCRRLLS